MSVDLTTLEIKVITDSVEQATKRLDALEKQGGSSEKSIGALKDAFTGLIGPIAGVVSVMEGMQKMVEVTRQFDVLNAGLITATGSAANASVAFDALQKFAANTPFDLQQVTGAFTKLVNYGLNPSERALTAYGNTASAMGKSLDQMVEAVADAATGEFERLKDFGIRASKQGDDIKFTFRGVETTVKATTDNIQSYLIALSENNFADANANRMKTLDGALSNLGDAWDALFLNISKQGLGESITDSVRLATDAISGLNATLASGQAAGYIEGLKAKFAGFGSDIETTFNLVANEINVFFSDNEKEATDFVSNVLSEISRLPNDVRSWVQTMVVETVASIQELGSEFEALYEKTKAIFTDDTIEAAQQRNLARLHEIHSVRKDSIDWIIKERDTQIGALGEEIAKADQAKQKYIERQQAKSGGDSLERFGVGGKSDSIIGGSKTSKASGASEAATAKGPNDGAAGVQNLEYELSQQDQLISDHMQKQFETRSAWDAISDGAMSTSFSRKMEQWQQESDSRQAYLDREYDQNQDHFVRTQNQLNDWYNSNKITREKFDALTLSNVKKFNTQKEQLDKVSQNNQLSNSAIWAGAALNILSTLFANSKPIAVASALVSTYEGAAKALAMGPAGIPMAATIVAAGMMQVKNILSTDVGSHGGGGGSSSSIPVSSISNDLQSSSLPATAQKETPVTRTIYLASVMGGNEMKDSDLLKYSSLRELAEAINEESKLGTIKLVI